MHWHYVHPWLSVAVATRSLLAPAIMLSMMSNL